MNRLYTCQLEQDVASARESMRCAEMRADELAAENEELAEQLAAFNRQVILHSLPFLCCLPPPLQQYPSLLVLDNQYDFSA
jgi:hypothetical protein